jgi:hypothetical protein
MIRQVPDAHGREVRRYPTTRNYRKCQVERCEVCNYVVLSWRLGSGGWRDPLDPGQLVHEVKVGGGEGRRRLGIGVRIPLWGDAES